MAERTSAWGQDKLMHTKACFTSGRDCGKPWNKSSAGSKVFCRDGYVASWTHDASRLDAPHGSNPRSSGKQQKPAHTPVGNVALEECRRVDSATGSSGVTARNQKAYQKKENPTETEVLLGSACEHQKKRRSRRRSSSQKGKSCDESGEKQTLDARAAGRDDVKKSTAVDRSGLKHGGEGRTFCGSGDVKTKAELANASLLSVGMESTVRRLLPTLSEVRTALPVSLNVKSWSEVSMNLLKLHLKSRLNTASTPASLGDYRFLPEHGLGRVLCWDGQRPQYLRTGRLILVVGAQDQCLHYGIVVLWKKETIVIFFEPSLAARRDEAAAVFITDAGMGAGFFSELFIALTSPGHGLSPQNTRHSIDSSIFLRRRLFFHTIGHFGIEWPETVECLDESQYAALRSAVTRAVSVVLTPRGCGGTRLLSTLLKFLLENSCLWFQDQRPLLVVTEKVVNLSLEVPKGDFLILNDNILCPAREKAIGSLLLEKAYVDERICLVRNVMSVILALETRPLHQDELQGATSFFDAKVGQQRNYVEEWLFYKVPREEIKNVATKSETREYSAYCRAQGIHIAESTVGFTFERSSGQCTLTEGQTDLPHWQQQKRVYLWKKLQGIQPLSAFSQGIYELPSEDRWRLYKHWILLLRSKNEELLRTVLEEAEDRSFCYRESVAKKMASELVGNPVVFATPMVAVEQRAVIKALRPRILVAHRVIDLQLSGIFTSSVEQVMLITDDLDAQQVSPRFRLAQYRSAENLMPHRLTFQYVIPQHICDLLEVCTGTKMKSRATNPCSVRGIEGMTGFFRSGHRDEAILMLVQLAGFLQNHGYSRKPQSLVVLTLDADREETLCVVKAFKTHEVNFNVLPIDAFYPKCAEIVLFYAGFKCTKKTLAFAIGSSLYAVYGFFHMSATNNDMRSALMHFRYLTAGVLTLCCAQHPEKKILIRSPDCFKTKLQGNGCCRELCQDILPCGHSCSELCHRKGQGNIVCKKPCQQIICPRGHLCPRTCSEHCAQLCEAPLSVRLKKCGHSADVPCHLSEKPPRDYECREMVSVVRRCGHDAVVRCCDAGLYTQAQTKHMSRSGVLGDPHRVVLPCTELVRTRLPNCGHYANLSCSSAERDSLTYRCQEICTVLPCGHRASVRCSEREAHLCSEVVTKTLPCGHSVTRTCSDKTMCTVQVEQKLTCGHIVSLQCWQSTTAYWKSIRCTVKVRTCLPNCEHYADLPCCTKELDRVSYVCQEIGGVLDCGHEAAVPCHTKKHFRCTAMVAKTLPCGHKAMRACSDDSVACGEEVLKELECKHRALARCNEDVARLVCREVVLKRYGCGHSDFRWCSDSAGCKVFCSHTVACCGHSCSLPCGHSGANHVCRLCKKKKSCCIS